MKFQRFVCPAILTLLLFTSFYASCQNLIYKRNALGGTDIFLQGNEVTPIGHMNRDAFGNIVLEDRRINGNVNPTSNAPINQQLYTPDWEFLSSVLNAANITQVRKESATSTQQSNEAWERYKLALKEHKILIHKTKQYKDFYESYSGKPVTVRNGWHKVIEIFLDDNGEEFCQPAFAYVKDNIIQRYCKSWDNYDLQFFDWWQVIIKNPIKDCRAFIPSGANDGSLNAIYFIEYLIDPSNKPIVKLGYITFKLPTKGLVYIETKSGEIAGRCIDPQFKYDLVELSTPYFMSFPGEYNYTYYPIGLSTPKKGSFTITEREGKAIDLR